VNPAAGPPVITLLTDYGLVDEFVGVLHGVIARICPAAQIIDLSHGVPAQDVAAGAVMLANALPYLPVGVHVAVVDPGVGSDRRAVAVRLADRRLLVGPDNGLLWTAALGGGGVVAVAEISASPWRLEPLAATFHGRDIFAPVGLISPRANRSRLRAPCSIPSSSCVSRSPSRGSTAAS
jgi:S-adenosylmethionine hydrolase